MKPDQIKADVVYQCASNNPELVIHQDPARLSWEPVVKVEHYRLKQES